MSVGSGSIPYTNANYFIIDNDDDGNTQTLSFGSSFSNILNFDNTNNWFNLSNRLNIGGSGFVN